MKYKYTKDEGVCVSCNNIIKFVKKNDIVEFSEDDIKIQTLDGFEKIEEKKVKKQKIEEDEE